MSVTAFDRTASERLQATARLWSAAAVVFLPIEADEPPAPIVAAGALLGGEVAVAAERLAGRLAAARLHPPLDPIPQAEPVPYGAPYSAENLFQETSVLADIAGFYRAFGVQVAGSIRERPDHIAAELEFLALLAAKEAIATERSDSDSAELCRSAAARFLGEHVAWLPRFARELEAGGWEDMRREAVALACALRGAESMRLGVTEAPARSPVAATPDGFGCEGCPQAWEESPCDSE